ncbi:hypothetical protein ACIBG7_18705 [Nonomuraea sp. NPDC050328]|uniref:hypothetical protein n=1 Tax=Nonomuraea sp. NPDC050328 TaxID=3364361 RepID=UPI00378D4AB5
MADIHEDAVQAVAEALATTPPDAGFYGYAEHALKGLRAEGLAVVQATEHVALLARAEQGEAAIARVRALHAQKDYGPYCWHCSENDYPDYQTPWPCPTIQALDAEPNHG